MKMLGVRRARDIWARITRWMDLWGRGLHTGLAGDYEAEGAARGGRAASGGEEEYKAISQSYHDMVLSGNPRQAVRWATDREGRGGGGVSSWITNALKPGHRLLRFSGRSTWTRDPPQWKIPYAQP